MITLTIELALANINHSMIRAKKRADIAKFRRMLHGIFLAGGCEIDDPDSRDFWDAIDGQHFGHGVETPAILSHDWTVLEHKVLPRTIGTTGFDPSRVTLYLRLRHETGLTLSQLVTHMDHEAFNGPVLGRIGRLAKWRSHLSKDRRLSWRRRLAGDVVVHMGDLNAGGVVAFGRGQQVVHPHPGVMQITVLAPLRPGTRISLGRAVVNDRVNTDHPLICVPVTITKG